MVRKSAKFGLVFGAILFSQSASIFAANMEKIGTTYEIEEVSLLDVIMDTLKKKEESGELAKLQKQMVETSIDNIERPRGTVFPISDENSKRTYDPSVTLNTDITLPDGTVMYSAGTLINPLKIRPLTKRILFVDGDDEKQVEYAVQAYKNSGYRDKIVLTRGSFGDLTRKYKIRFYFDQLSTQTGPRGRITLAEQFGIQKVPSVVYQGSPEQLYLTIEEVKL